ncbi:MAG TPA: outer membrane beta-barrel protein [Rhodothermales bacterium]|nr:outer membrane beta-barrel protein [Rhodothermales bacterium]
MSRLNFCNTALSGPRRLASRRGVTCVLVLCCCLCSCLGGARSSTAQGSRVPPEAAGHVRGQVLDARTNDVVPMASITLFVVTPGDSAFVTGAIASAEGAFEVGPVRLGTYHVRISSVGYAARTRTVTLASARSVSLGEIRLEPVEGHLDGIDVVTEQVRVVQQADRTVYNVANQPGMAASSFLEALQTLPSIEVDAEGRISFRGNQNVAVHIDGRPVLLRGAELAALLRQLPASTVRAIEVIPNPSARYDADAMGGILNVLLKEGTGRGLTGALTVGAGTAPTGEASGNLSYQRDRWDVTGSFGLRRNTDGTNGTAERQTPEMSMHQVFGTQSTFGSLSTRVAGSYAVSRGLQLRFNGAANTHGGDNDGWTSALIGPSGAVTRRDRQNTASVHSGGQLDVAFGLRRTFAPAANRRPAHVLTAEVRHVRQRERDDDHFALWSYEGGAVRLDSTVGTHDVRFPSRDASAQADYVRPIREGRLEAGVKLSTRHQDNDVFYEALSYDGAGHTSALERDRSNRFRLDEALHAAYVQATRRVGKLDMQGGLRVESFGRRYTLDVAGARTDGRIAPRTDLFPSAFASYDLGRGSVVKASVSRRVSRPSAFQINPFTAVSDRFNVTVGNPDLRPEFTSAYELTGQYRALLTVTLFMRHTRGVIRPRYRLDPTTGIQTHTFENFAQGQSYGADAAIIAARGRWLRSTLSGSLYQSITRADATVRTPASSGTVWSVRANVQARLREGTDLQVLANYVAPTPVPDGTIGGRGQATVGLGQRLLKDRGTLTVRASDVLGTMRFRVRSSGEGYTSLIRRDPRMRHLTVAFTYSFGRAVERDRRPILQEQELAP